MSHKNNQSPYLMKQFDATSPTMIILQTHITYTCLVWHFDVLGWPIRFNDNECLFNTKSPQCNNTSIHDKTKLRNFAWYTFVPPLLSLCLPPPFAFCQLDGDTWAVWSQRRCSCVCFLNNCSLLLDCYHFHSTYLNLHIGHVFTAVIVTP